MNKWIAVAAFSIFGLATGSIMASETTATSEPRPTLWHLGLVVSDLVTMDLFYGDVIGLQRERQLLVEDTKVASGTEGAIVTEHLDTLMAVNGTRIEIRQYSEPRNQKFFEVLHFPEHPARSVEHGTDHPLGFSHIGLSVASIDSVLDRMEQWSLGTLMSGPQRLDEFGGLRIAFLKDPEGNIVELMEAGSGQAD